MASTAMRGLQSTLATATAALGHVAAAEARSNTENVDLPALRLSAKSSFRQQSSDLRPQLLPSFNVSIPSLQRRKAKRVEAVKGGALSTTSFATDAQQLKEAKEEIKKLLTEKKAHGILIRLGWHDAGTYDKNISAWPKSGGANGSLRFVLELGHSANAGLVDGVKLLEPIKEKFPGVSYADLFQLASATAIEDAGGPKIPMKYGRVDTKTEEECCVEGNLPAADPPKPADHLRQVFYRMGLNDKEIVALSGAHTIGRSRPERSGFGKKETKYTNPKDKDIGNPGGQSWTVEWLKFDNSYFKDIKAQADEDLLVLPTDKILTEDPEFKVYTDIYAENQDAFFADYAAAHKKLSELGTKFDPPQGISVDDVAPKAEKFVPASKTEDELIKEATADLQKNLDSRQGLEERYLVINSGKNECRSCGYVYDSKKGDPNYPIPGGVVFSDLPTDWRCPTCGAAQSYFQSKGVEVAGFVQNQNYGLGGNAMTESQKSLLIYGSLVFFFALFLAGYLLQ